MASQASTVIFDLGGVLVDWDPRHLDRKLIPDAAAMEHFLGTVCTPEWNLAQDGGRSFAEAAALLKRDHPGKADLIDAFFARWPEMIAGPIAGTVEILAALRRRGVPLYALTNWSAETYPHALARFDFLGWFRGVLVSGHVGLVKPDPAIFHLMLDRFEIEAEDAVYIDDNAANVATAAALGMLAIRFTEPAALARELEMLGLLPGAAVSA